MIIDIKNLSKSYSQGGKKIQILKGLNLSVEKQQSIAVVGKSGSGKSTFLSLAAGLDRPDSGAITLHGKDIVTFSESELALFRADNVGIIFQQFHLMQNLTTF